MMKKIVWLVAVALVLSAAPAMAKEGYYISAILPNETISGDAGANLSSGSGWGARAGLGFNRYLAIEGTYTTTKHDITGGPSVDLNGLAGDIKLNFPLTSLDSNNVMTVEPYILLGYEHYELTTTPSAKGDGTQYGIGLEVYLFRELSINAGWTKTKVTFKDGFSVDGDVTRVDFGILYHFI